VWLDRRYRSTREWFGRQSYPVRASLGCAGLFVLLCSPGWCLIGGLFVRAQYIHWFVYTTEDRAFVRNGRNGYEGGLPSVARRLKAEMEPIQDPETAVRLHPDWGAKRFKNGEWVFGRGIDSHGFSVGQGTLVLKDSRGRIRIFFGHVCGSNPGLGPYASQYIATLDDFYKEWWLSESGMLREWVPPP
jgi:hypothetical protein